MLLNENVLQVFSEGNNSGCEHEWVYDKPDKMTFTTPFDILGKRICECCNRVEYVSVVAKRINFDKAKFDKLFTASG